MKLQLLSVTTKDNIIWLTTIQEACYAKYMFAQRNLSASRLGGRQLQAGQILLIVILVVIIASTIGLSLVSRSITGIRISSEEEDAQKALAAAEAGLERAIQANSVTSVSGNLDNGSSYSAEYAEVKSSGFLLNGASETRDSDNQILSVTPNIVTQNEGADIWLVGRNTQGNPDYSTQVIANNFNLYWGLASDDPCDIAAIQVIVITRNPFSPNEVKSYRYAYDGCSVRSQENGFTQVSSGSYNIINKDNELLPVAFKHSTPYNQLVRANTVLIRVVPLYKNTIVGVYACNTERIACADLPSQGYIVTSTGSSAETSGKASRKITVFRGYPQTYLPFVSYGLFVAND